MKNINTTPHLRETFLRIKPLCDSIMKEPSPDHLAMFGVFLEEMKQDTVQDMQPYLLYPFTSHLQAEDNAKNYKLKLRVVETMKDILQRVKVGSYEMVVKVESLLIKTIFDKSRPGMIADIPEELKLGVVQCLTTLALNMDQVTRIKMLEGQVPLLAQTIFVSVHLAKLEKLRSLRLAALNCMAAHTMTHPQLTDKNDHITDPLMEIATVNMMAAILPGVLAALQDVATCADNPGHAIVVAALSATHRVLCTTMHNKHLHKKQQVTAEDFLKLVAEKGRADREYVSEKEILHDAKLNTILKAEDYAGLAEYLYQERKLTENVTLLCMNQLSKERGTRGKGTRKRPVKDKGSEHKEGLDYIVTVTKTKDIPKRTPEWYAMAGEKLVIVVKNLVPLVTHDHFKVRKELAVLCYRILSECSATMQPSLPMALDVLITLSTDPYKEVSEYCAKGITTHFATASKERQVEAIDSLCENFFTTLNCLPRILNNIDSNRKLSVLSLLYGYLKILCDDGRPQRLTSALSTSDGFHRLCDALLAAADLQTDLALLTRHAGRDVTSTPPTGTPWCRLRHLDDKECERRLQDVCQMLGAAECAELFLDRLLGLFHERRSCELVYIMNWVASAPNSTPNLAKRVINTYIEEELWYLPLEVSSGEAPLTSADTLDPTVYNPRAWTRDSVPDLYEGTTEVRYTDVSYAEPRERYIEPNTCRSLAEAQRNMAFSCLVTEGLGMMARRLGAEYQPYLLRTLCLILERVGSSYEYLHLAGLKAITDVAAAFGHKNVTELIAENADYFTSQITSRLKKAWNTQSALQILSVVLQYSDCSILDYLYGIVEHVVVQCCDKYYERHLQAYLQVFLAFVTCIRRWYPDEITAGHDDKDPDIDVMNDVVEFAVNKEECARLLTAEEFDTEVKSAKEMYEEDMKRKEEEILDYEDPTTEESPPLPQHIRVTVTILRRCVNFIPSSREESLLALQILTSGLPILRGYENELLPLVHLTWAPLVARFHAHDPPLMRRAFDLFVVLAALSKDFLRSRAVKDVLQETYKFLTRSAQESHLKDTGSAYRVSHSYYLQLAALGALPALLADLRLDDERLSPAAASVQPYLCRKQPRPLQTLAVKFFKELLRFNYGAAWYHLRGVCCNSELLQPPQLPRVGLTLRPVLGTPYSATDQDYDANIKLIFQEQK